MTPSEVAAICFTAVVGLVVALLKYAQSQRDALMERRLNELEDKYADLLSAGKDIDMRLRTGEIQWAKFEGELKLLSQNHDHLDKSLSEIKDAIVPRAEWEHRMTAVEKLLMQIQQSLVTMQGHGQGVSQAIVKT